MEMETNNLQLVMEPEIIEKKLLKPYSSSKESREELIRYLLVGDILNDPEIEIEDSSNNNRDILNSNFAAIGLELVDLYDED